MLIYDLDREEVLRNCCNLTEREIAAYCGKEDWRCTIYTVSDYIQSLQDNDVLEDELNGRTVKEFMSDLISGKAPQDCESGIYLGCDYVIAFVC